MDLCNQGAEIYQPHPEDAFDWNDLRYKDSLLIRGKSSLFVVLFWGGTTLVAVAVELQARLHVSRVQEDTKEGYHCCWSLNLSFSCLLLVDSGFPVIRNCRGNGVH